MNVSNTIKTIANVSVKNEAIEWRHEEEQSVAKHLMKLVRMIYNGRLPTYPGEHANCLHGVKCTAMTMYHMLLEIDFFDKVETKGVCGCFFYHTEVEINQNSKIVGECFEEKTGTVIALQRLVRILSRIPPSGVSAKKFYTYHIPTGNMAYMNIPVFDLPAIVENDGGAPAAFAGPIGAPKSNETHPIIVAVREKNANDEAIVQSKVNPVSKNVWASNALVAPVKIVTKAEWTMRAIEKEEAIVMELDKALEARRAQLEEAREAALFEEKLKQAVAERKLKEAELATMMAEIKKLTKK